MLDPGGVEVAHTIQPTTRNQNLRTIESLKKCLDASLISRRVQRIVCRERLKAKSSRLGLRASRQLPALTQRVGPQGEAAGAGAGEGAARRGGLGGGAVRAGEEGAGEGRARARADRGAMLSPTLRTQRQQNTNPLPFVPRMRFLLLDFGGW
eukprot:3734442-Rhodomonas_salina.1